MNVFFSLIWYDPLVIRTQSVHPGAVQTEWICLAKSRYEQ